MDLTTVVADYCSAVRCSQRKKQKTPTADTKKRFRPLRHLETSESIVVEFEVEQTINCCFDWFLNTARLQRYFKDEFTQSCSFVEQITSVDDKPKQSLDSVIVERWRCNLD